MKTGHKFQLRTFGKDHLRGMTMIEMILVVSLISMIGLSLFQVLSSGIKIWQRSQQTAHDEDVILFLEQLNFDLRNTVLYSLIKPAWEEDRVSWATIVTTRMDRHISQQRVDYTKQIGRVEYYFDKNKKAIFRRQANYSQALKDKYGPPKEVVSDVRQGQFLFSMPKKKENRFSDSQDAAVMPAAVRIEFEIIEASGFKRKVQRLFNIPMGTS